MSPSNKYAIYSVEYGDVSFGSKDPTARKEFWLVNSNSQRKLKLLEGFLLGGIGDVQWLNNETKIVFDYGYEGGVRLYIADLQRWIVTPLNEASDFKGGTEQLWDVSPNGKTLAVIDSGLELYLVDLESGKSNFIDGAARFPA
jgi:WD40 repeat protein